ncbi:MAG: YIP1 family protein [Patescibacteria group bacterium]
MDIAGSLLTGGIAFVQNIVGIVFRPYETYRRLVARRSLWELVYLGAFLAGYFALASVVKTSAFRPFLLTRQFVVLAAGAGATYLGAVGMIWVIGKKLGGKGTLAGVMVGWGYTLVPTLVWFFATSLLYVVLPPPRTTSAAGIVFSIVYLIFSATLFWWKLILAYLTLRFGLRLDLQRIAIVALAAVPVVAVYSVGMYWLGIFRVPFL